MKETNGLVKYGGKAACVHDTLVFWRQKYRRENVGLDKHDGKHRCDHAVK